MLFCDNFIHGDLHPGFDDMVDEMVDCETDNETDMMRWLIEMTNI